MGAKGVSFRKWDKWKRRKWDGGGILKGVLNIEEEENEENCPINFSRGIIFYLNRKYSFCNSFPALIVVN